MNMRAAVFAGPRRIEVRDVPRPEPGPGQVRVRLEGCGLCGSNLPVWEGRPWFAYPLEPGAPGHEGWGVVDAVGPGVPGVEPGQRVTALTYHAFAEYDLADAAVVVPVAAALESVPIPGEPLGCAHNVLQRSGIAPGETVCIIGIGFLGALLTSLAVGAGARVVAVTRRAWARHLATALGAHASLPFEPDEVIRQVRELTDGRGCACVVEAVGAQAALDLATELCAVRGRLVVAGYHQDGLRQVNLQKWNWQGLDVINAHERESAVYVSGMHAALEALRQERLRLGPLLTHRIPLADLATGFDLMQARPAGFLKALVEV